MGNWEDFWWETHNEVQELGLKKEFDTQLKKMESQDKHKYKDTRARWEYAKTKVIKKQNNKNEKNKNTEKTKVRQKKSFGL